MLSYLIFVRTMQRERVTMSLHTSDGNEWIQHNTNAIQKKRTTHHTTPHHHTTTKHNTTKHDVAQEINKQCHYLLARSHDYGSKGVSECVFVWGKGERRGIRIVLHVQDGYTGSQSGQLCNL